MPKITFGKKQTPVRAVVYGPEGIGKSTLASKTPDPLFIDIEKGTSQIDTKRFDPSPTSYRQTWDQIQYVIDHPDSCDTLVIDTIDALENQIVRYVCERDKMQGIESYGYGKGYTYIAEEMQKVLGLLGRVIDKGINVVILGHSQIKRFELPDEVGGYDRYELKLTRQTAPKIKEWADMLLFVNYKTSVVKTDANDTSGKSNKAFGGERVIYTEHRPTWDAKNRYGLKDCLPLKYESIAKAFPEGKQPPEELPFDLTQEVEIEEKKSSTVPEKLQKLMDRDGFTEYDICNALDYKGIESNLAKDGTINLGCFDQKFIEKNVIGKWNGFKKVIEECKEKKYVGFINAE